MQTIDSGSRAGGFSAEIKFVVDRALGVQIREWARARLAADPHGSGPFADEYRVHSVYFDTSDRDVFHRRGSYGRSKYRIRRYSEGPVVFLERKLRNGGRLSKRRTTIDVTTLPHLAVPGMLNGDGTAWFRRRVALRGLQPVCQVTYVRTARMGETPDGEVRLTIDESVRAFSSDAFTFEPHAGMPLLDDVMIIELKYRGRVPAIFRELIDTFALTPGRSSKYRIAAQALGLVETADAPPAGAQALDA